MLRSFLAQESVLRPCSSGLYHPIDFQTGFIHMWPTYCTVYTYFTCIYNGHILISVHNVHNTDTFTR